MLTVVQPGTAILEAKSVGEATVYTGFVVAGIASATLKVAALTAEYGAYTAGKEPDWNAINKMNDYSDAVNTVSLITSTVYSPSTKPLEVIAGALGAATDAGTQKAATKLGEYAGSDKEAELSRGDQAAKKETELPNRPSTVCVTVSALKGWQAFDLPGDFSHIVSVKGGWSVYPQCSLCGPSGHTGADAKLIAHWEKYRFDTNFPFGALLMKGSDNEYSWIKGKGKEVLAKPTNQVSMRINDPDDGVYDNRGALTVCFGR